MLVLLSFLLLFLILGIIYLGIALSETIKEADNKALFWILYIVTILSIIQFIVIVIFFIKYRKKIGPLGPRGFMGEKGEAGDPGSCGDQPLKECRYKSLMLLIKKRFEESLGRDLLNENKETQKSEIDIIYDFVYTNQTYLQNTTYEDLRKFNSALIAEIEYLKKDKSILSTEIINKLLNKSENTYIGKDLKEYLEN